MARLARVAPAVVTQHFIQRGNNRQACFTGDNDLKVYLHWLKEWSKKHQVDVHAWVLMTNHVPLLCTPWKENAVSRMIQSIGCLYVRYFNHTYRRSGTLWEGRFKSYLAQSVTFWRCIGILSWTRSEQIGWMNPATIAGQVM
jgi:putative transposase